MISNLSPRCTISARVRTHIVQCSGSPTNPFPCVIQHDSATYWNSCLVLHESIECLLVVVTPLMQERASMEQHCRKLLQRKRWEFWILFSNKILVEPMTENG